MARRKQISGTQKFITIALSLIAIEIAYLMFFSRGNAPVTVREAIVKTAEKHGELSDQRREQLKIQLALADFKAKNNRYPGNINELIPDYFVVFPSLQPFARAGLAQPPNTTRAPRKANNLPVRI